MVATPNQLRPTGPVTGIETTRQPLVERGMLTARVAVFLHACVRARRSIVSPAIPSAASQPCCRAPTAELDPALRVVVAEEVFEVDIPLPNRGVPVERQRGLPAAGLDQ